MPAHLHAILSDVNFDLERLKSTLDDRFIIARLRTLEVYADCFCGDRYSSISLLKRFTLLSKFFCDKRDVLVDLNMSDDGQVIVITQKGMLRLFPRE